MSALTLADLPPGTRARLTEIGGERSFRRRLLELGLLPGSVVEIVRRADVGGVLELEVRRSRLSVRLAEAACVHVQPLEERQPAAAAERARRASRRPA